MAFTAFTAVRNSTTPTTIDFTWAYTGTVDHYEITGASHISVTAIDGAETSISDALNLWFSDAVTIAAYDASSVLLDDSGPLTIAAAPPTLTAPTALVAGINSSNQVACYFTPPPFLATLP
jgi:hypothetical protein